MIRSSPMKTVHERAAGALLDEILLDSTASTVLVETRDKLRSRELDHDYVAAIGQTHARVGHWPMDQVAAYLTVHANLMSGRFGMTTIEVGHGPASDSERSANAEALADLPRPFEASVHAGQQCHPDGDGQLVWLEPITIEKSTGLGEVGGNGVTRPLLAPYVVRADSVPLEIGLSKPSVTFGHLSIRHLGVARWPYGAPYITLLLNLDAF